MWLCIITLIVGYWTVKWFLERLKVEHYGEKYVFITGCDTGFGNILAKRLDGLGFHVIAACLKQDGADELKKTSSERLQTLQLDITSEDDIKSALTKVNSILPPSKGLWAVVNNAGIMGAFGPSECLNRKDYMEAMDVNVYGLIDVTKMFIPLVRRERGRIVNMASVAGRLSGGFPIYCVTKYGVEAFSDSLRREVYCQGIKVIILEPGAFITNITNPTLIKENYQRTFKQGDAACQQYYGEDFINKRINNHLKVLDFPGNIDAVIDAYEHAITARYPKYRYLCGNDAKYFYRFLWTVPEWMSDFILCYSSPRPAGIK
ncbi:retinol dehydrogenase 7 isoform X2 [Patella vulgata]|nr:retinol dehydrogenase 7 isoform X2 [Patella vulgata]XP_050412514.2 retinol dehydrogenase 7 isoform X2 [Patella vulgata]